MCIRDRIAPAYQEFSPQQTPLERRENGTEIRVITGRTDHGTTGIVRNDHVHPTYLDVTLPAGTSFEQSVPADDNAFLFVIDGEMAVGEQVSTLARRTLGILSPGARIAVSAGQGGARFLLVSAQPLGEPVARGGPFVMNTKEEIMQAFNDYQHNRF